MAKKETSFVCENCGYESGKWLGKCPSCNEWNSFAEFKITKSSKSRKKSTDNPKKAVLISNIENLKVERYKSGINEFDRVLGGGIVPGALILIGGEPGIGKSTLMLQVAELISRLGNILYVSGEESASQIKMRSKRLNITGDNIHFLGETELETIEETIEKLKPMFLIVDSIQTAYTSQIDKAPGSILQTREVTNRLLEISKNKNIATFIIGHVTKEGSLAGPKILEHIVDTVLYFETSSPYLILRAVKNRFGNTDEIGIFDMHETGITEITNPYDILIHKKEAEGIAITSIMEGSRTLLIEVQALVSNATFSSPRRLIDGVEMNKVNKVIAVIEKQVGINLSLKDVYINLAGGIKVKEPAIDLAIAASVISSAGAFKIDKNSAFIGELGLTGEIRNVSKIKERISEASRLGINNVYIPKGNITDDIKSFSNKIIECENIQELALKIGYEKK